MRVLTRADIIADVKGMRLSPQNTALLIALGAFQLGLPGDQSCPDCEQPLVAVGLPKGTSSPGAWAVRCGCGESVFRGL